LDYKSGPATLFPKEVLKPDDDLGGLVSVLERDSFFSRRRFFPLSSVLSLFFPYRRSLICLAESHLIWYVIPQVPLGT